MSHIEKERSQSAASTPQRQPEVVIGTLDRLDEAGMPLVDWPDNPAGKPVAALATATYAAGDIGSSVALLFADGNPVRPLIVGLVRQPMDDVLRATENDVASVSEANGAESQAESERVVITADKEIVLQCGKASITLTRSGKIIQRGTFILSRSSGSNKIKGGSIELN